MKTGNLEIDRAVDALLDALQQAHPDRKEEIARAGVTVTAAGGRFYQVRQAQPAPATPRP